ncbi:unnamed protein product [Cuscuta epithymum]|uniref:Transducin/WD40 repeat-like superfamily protein n=1 Tax=Cuscuta epithymum TaxID=186058 RepID=A0AAV0CUF6_9ASTE|nr:unnamed protein product [Cuscuta epithymum]
MEAERTNILEEAPDKRRKCSSGKHQPEKLLLLTEKESAADKTSPPSGVEVLLFDYSVENHFRAIETVSKLCGEPDIDDFTDQADLQRFGSSITFLSEWRHLSYKPRRIRFACQSETGNGKYGKVEETVLPQFSASTVPKGAWIDEKVNSTQPCNDLVLYVGGSVWGIDWCPTSDKDPECQFQSEFVAIAAHPPQSSYHKLGAPLTGRGAVQIWCLLNYEPTNVKGEIFPIKSPNNPIKPRGRPRKKPPNASLNDKHGDNENVQPLAVEYPRETSTVHNRISVACENINKSHEDSRRKQKITDQLPLIGASASEHRRLECSAVGQTCDSSLPLLSWHTNGKSPSIPSCQASTSCALVSMESSGNDTSPMEIIPKDVALPRMVLCLAHNGKVAWDIKWRPKGFSSSGQRMGYLAVLLGSGALEVWEVPFPRIIKRLYSPDMEGTDPRFIKLEPVFRCSKLKCGDRQSIPLTVEWSMSSSHDMILAGCHDGVVALWKFSTTNSSKDTRPLLCFSADTVPIRSLAWAPFESSESENIIITASHKGLKYWDLRDPFQHLREYNPGQGVGVYSLDWLRDPRCILVACDDGTLRIQSVVKAANDFHVSGKPLTISKQHGFHTYMRSSYAIWSLQTSRRTEVVAYCGADGTAAYFQLTKQAESDAVRNRTPHFLCGSFVEEESAITVISPMPNTPFRMIKTNKWTDLLRTTRTSASGSPNQEKRTKGDQLRSPPSSDKQLVLYSEDGSDDQALAHKNKQAPKLKANNIKETKAAQPPPFSGQVDGYELPPKSVAIHRVRWNMNKGSEKWLCYGGAAGIVRCQWIDTPAYY